ncbi:flagellar hook-associated protein FlgK [Paenibacillus sp. NPDC056579]|uniref:flagellar hook-associated protein FlgK n=1 Tax=Paenibacillus sp. NPDC056579 TaxID=3345871 RepID=UPI0036CECC88
MRSTFHGIETAKRSLFTQQAALQTTGHNIANASTAGYSRQVVNMTASRPIEAVGMMHSSIPGQLGTGVEFTSITRVREKFLDDQFRNENKNLGSWEVQSDTLEKIEAIVSEPSDSGIRTVMDSFWKSWSELSKNPEDVTGRKIVRENAIALADAFNLTSKQLKDLSNDLTENINVKVNEINSISTTIANLNSEIQRIEGLGDNANDLRDQRDLLTDQLSKIANIQVQDTPQGYTIALGGSPLVDGGATTPTTTDILTAAFNSGALNSGQVHGMMLSRDRYVADYQRQLDTMANTLVNGEFTITIPKDSVLPEGTIINNVVYTGENRKLASDLTVKINGINGLHQLGYTLGSPPTKGGAFFTTKDNSGTVTAENIQLSAAIIASGDNIATSLRTVGTGADESVVKGNNGLALLMSQLKDVKFTINSSTGVTTGTVDDYYRSIVGQLGVQGMEASRNLTNQQSLVDQVSSRRESVSGVSLDEEMANMIKFQHAYNAAARAMTTFDETLDKVINGMGVVGR